MAILEVSNIENILAVQAFSKMSASHLKKAVRLR